VGERFDDGQTRELGVLLIRHRASGGQYLIGFFRQIDPDQDLSV
jgi:hypothetical protein